jgi:hypothetical protein
MWNATATRTTEPGGGGFTIRRNNEIAARLIDVLRHHPAHRSEMPCHRAGYRKIDRLGGLHHAKENTRYVTTQNN